MGRLSHGLPAEGGSGPVGLRLLRVRSDVFRRMQQSVHMQKNTPDSCEPGYESTNKVVEEEPVSPVDFR